MQFTQQEAAVILSSTFVLELLTGHFNSLQNTLYFLILWEMIINLKFYSYLSYVYVWFIYFFCGEISVKYSRISVKLVLNR